MGTSGSSSGSPSGSPLVPSWVSNPGEIGDSGDTPIGSPETPQTPADSPPPSPSITPIAPRGRFSAARFNFGKFASSGDERSLRKGLGHYVRTGYGGASTASKRLGSTTRTAEKMFSALAALASGSPTLSGTQLDPNLLKGRTARQIVGAIVEALRPTDGTQDAEAGRRAMTDAFAELLNKHPQADLMQLTDDQRLDVTEYYIGNDIFNRVWLDVGMAVQDKAASAGLSLARMTEIQQYIKNEVARVFLKERGIISRWTSGAVKELIDRVISRTLSIFGDYHE